MHYIMLVDKPVVGERMNTRGVEWGPKGIILVHREGWYGVYKIPGHKTWGGNFKPWYYARTRYGIVMILEGGGREGRLTWGSIHTLPRSDVSPGSAWRGALRELKYEAGKLEAGDADVLEHHGIKRALRV